MIWRVVFSTFHRQGSNWVVIKYNDKIFHRSTVRSKSCFVRQLAHAKISLLSRKLTINM